MRLVADIEANGLLKTITKIHCIVAIDIDTEDVYRFTPDTLEEGLKLLEEAEELVFHNGIGYDIPAIQKLYPHWKPKNVKDTLVLSRLIYSNLSTRDMNSLAKGTLSKESFTIWDRKNNRPKLATGSHSLEAWGRRLGELKGDYGHTSDWTEFSEEMLEYCVQDVRVTLRLYKLMLSKEYSVDAIELEHQVAELIERQITYGWEFDVTKAQELYAKLCHHRARMNQELTKVFPGWYEPMKTPAYYEITIEGQSYKGNTKKELEDLVYSNSRSWIVPKLPTRATIKNQISDGPLKQKHTPFNPNSRLHIYRVFKEKYAWEPQEWTEDGSPVVDEDVLNSLKFPEAKVLAESFMVAKRIGQLAEGEQNWLDAQVNGRIFGYVNTLGANTHRATHSDPNLAQVPSSKPTKEHKEGKPYGKECRELFKVKPGYVLVGADASGQELRCLAHYMAKYDKGAYGKVVVGGDIHSLNQQAAGLPTRDNAKTFIYGWLYGAGDPKIGSIIGKGAKEGKRLKEKFLKELPALAELKEYIVEYAKKHGYIIGLDARVIYIRSPHSALNALLQSCGAILTKRWMVTIDRLLKERGLSSYAAQVGWIHDEVQFEVKQEYANEVGQIAVEAMKLTEEYYGFKCQLDAEYKIGLNWKETH